MALEKLLNNPLVNKILKKNKPSDEVEMSEEERVAVNESIQYHISQGFVFFNRFRVEMDEELRGRLSDNQKLMLHECGRMVNEFREIRVSCEIEVVEEWNLPIFDMKARVVMANGETMAMDFDLNTLKDQPLFVSLYVEGKRDEVIEVVVKDEGMPWNGKYHKMWLSHGKNEHQLCLHKRDGEGGELMSVYNQVDTLIEDKPTFVRIE